MEPKHLEQLAEYMHLNYAAPPFPGERGIYCSGESVAVLGSTRVAYFWNTFPSGGLAGVVVPGVLVKERFRADGNGNVYSLVGPVAEEDKPALETMVWFEMIRMFGNAHSGIKFSYWSSSGAAQRPQQREQPYPDKQQR
ncbi:hypothetical protein HYU17_05755 [Candidatus Woesearchaeota archaeon]|nr:hypothetical protein [Candidatus Woesearchaeota archaeon]